MEIDNNNNNENNNNEKNINILPALRGTKTLNLVTHLDVQKLNITKKRNKMKHICKI